LVSKLVTNIIYQCFDYQSNWFLNCPLTLATNNGIFIMFLRIIVHFSIFIYHVSYLIIFKINVSTYQIRVVSDTRIVSVHHSLFLNTRNRKNVSFYI